MILASLRDLAERERLVDDPAFESKPVRWVIDLSEDGSFENVFDTNADEVVEPGSKKKPRRLAKLMLIPRRQGRSSGIKADFLVDNAKYALGLPADPAEADDPRLAQCHAAFVALLRSAPNDVPELQSVLAFLANEAETTRCAKRLSSEGGFASNDLFSFAVDGFALAEVEALKAWWGDRHNQASESAAAVQCLVCGEHRAPARLHNSFQIRGASTSGVPLVCFNADAFEKYGLSGNENAPVCTVCMTAYTEALRRLTRPQYKTADGRDLRPLKTELNGDTTAVYWADGQSAFPSLVERMNNEPKDVEKALKSAWQGTEFHFKDPSRFFCLVLTGGQGRATVRRIHTGTVSEVAANLHRNFRAIETARLQAGAPIPMLFLLKSLVLNGELDRLPADLATSLWFAALFAVKLPPSFLAAVVTRNRVEPENQRENKWKVGRERAALLQLYFVTHEIEPTNGDALDEEGFIMALNEASRNPAYVLGRVLAVAESMQQAAQGELNRTVVDRFFGMASVRPKAVFTQLADLYGHHKRKALRDRPGSTRAIDKLWGQVLDLLEDDAFTQSFTLEDQARFGLGYYHQKQDFVNQAVARKAERERLANAETEANNAEIAEETQA